MTGVLYGADTDQKAAWDGGRAWSGTAEHQGTREPPGLEEAPPLVPAEGVALPARTWISDSGFLDCEIRIHVVLSCLVAIRSGSPSNATQGPFLSSGAHQPTAPPSCLCGHCSDLGQSSQCPARASAGPGRKHRREETLKSPAWLCPPTLPSRVAQNPPPGNLGMNMDELSY